MRMLFIVAISTACCCMSFAQSVDGVKKLNIQSLIKQAKEQKTDWIKFLDEETVFAGVYLLKAGQKDDQPIHEYDEVYYVVAGESDFEAEGTKIKATPGKIIFVKAGVDHHFLNIKKDLELLVLFSKAKTGPKKITAEEFNTTELVKVGKPNENSWNPFVNKATMSFGLYQLPKALGGDSTLVHKWDEINFVTKGAGKFSVNGKDMDVSIGDIVYVKKGLGHYFHSLTSDFDVLILFEKKSVEQK